jgi:hypothetical protein
MAPELCVDLHGYHPNSLGNEMVALLLQQAWEMGAPTFTFIHGHGRFRGPAPFANTNTGWLGLTVRRILRWDVDLRQWMYAKFDMSNAGATTVRLRPNPSPTRSKLDFSFMPERDYNR